MLAEGISVEAQLESSTNNVPDGNQRSAPLSACATARTSRGNCKTPVCCHFLSAPCFSFLSHVESLENGIFPSEASLSRPVQLLPLQAFHLFLGHWAAWNWFPLPCQEWEAPWPPPCCFHSAV